MKTRLKTILISGLVTIGAFTAVGYVSCNRDKCKTIVCANNGVCNNGQCICPSGYEGTNCETISREKFLGDWNVFEKGSVTNQAAYGITIAKAELITDVVIVNFYNYFKTNVRASVVHDTLFIPNQQYEGKLLFGVGTIYPNSTYGQYGYMTVRYEIVDTATQLVNDFGYNSVIDGSDPSQWNK